MGGFNKIFESVSESQLFTLIFSILGYISVKIIGYFLFLRSLSNFLDLLLTDASFQQLKASR